MRYNDLVIELWAEHALIPYLSFVSKHFADYNSELMENLVLKSWKTNIEAIKENFKVLTKFAEKIPTRCIAAFWLADDITDSESFRAILSLSHEHKQQFCDRAKTEISMISEAARAADGISFDVRISLMNIDAYLRNIPDDDLKQALQNQFQRLVDFDPN